VRVLRVAAAAEYCTGGCSAARERDAGEVECTGPADGAGGWFE